MILLTDAEISNLWLNPPVRVDAADPLSNMENAAKAQARKILEWGIEPCTEHLVKYNGRVDLMQGIMSKRECPYCWQDAAKELG